MADIIETPTAEQQQQAANTELATQMAISLNGGVVQQNIEPDLIVDPTVIVAPPLTFESIKDKFGYTTPEDAIKEIEDYRIYKTAPPPKPEYKFEDEQSEKLFKAWTGGKKAEVLSFLKEQETLDAFTSQDVTKDNADQIIKLGLQIKYKDLSPAEIDYKYKKQFSIPKAPVQTDIETDTDFLIRTSEWEQIVADTEMDKIMEAKLMRPELEARKAKLILPQIEQSVDEDYAAWKTTQVEAEKIDTQTKDAYKTFTPKTLETKVNFNDVANKIAFEYQYEPTVEKLSQTVDMVTDINKFYNLFVTQDGKPDRERFAKAIHFAVNYDTILNDAMNQAKNATLKAQMPDNTGGMVRQMAQSQAQLGELDQQMQAAGVVRR